ncbi:unnamed protein product [Pedinophyceae sp. YPF-701]|nr:unnamed protein product [Pedinophyceae sp. YPF-701]
MNSRSLLAHGAPRPTWARAQGRRSTVQAPARPREWRLMAEGDAAGARTGLLPGTELQGDGPAVTLTDMLQESSGDSRPRFVSPIADVPGRDPSALPLMVYLPGIDGTGLAAARQFPRLMEKFDLRAMTIPPQNRSGFRELVRTVIRYIEAECAGADIHRPVYILGESFGGLLGAAVAEALPDLVHRVVMVNPATSFSRTNWQTVGPLLGAVPDQAYAALPFALSPVLGNPLQMAAAGAGIELPATLQDALGRRPNGLDNMSPPELAQRFVAAIVDLLPTLGSLSEILPRGTLLHKLKLLGQGCEYMEANNDARLKRVRQRVLVVTGANDLLLPSDEEGERLARLMPCARSVLLEGRSHALLQESGICLTSILVEQDFYITRRRFTSPAGNKPRPSNPKPGTVAPLEIPTKGDVVADCKELNIELLQRVCSPIFLSTAEDGTVGFGLDRVPDQGPILLVGNHQLFAPDLGVIIQAFAIERGILPRGLAHPVIFSNPGSSYLSDDGETDDDDAWFKSRFGQAPARSPGGGAGGLGALFSRYGAVPVSPTNLFKLMKAKEVGLLFPGGVREAYKRRGEKYQLFWPERAEFVRMCARHGATIVPFSAIGAEDSVDIFLDSSELLDSPLFGNSVRQGLDDIPRARRGVSANDYDEGDFVPPIPTPRVPSRFYFKFHRPIKMKPSDLDDKEYTQQVYSTVKAEVADGISYLLQRREDDPYRDTVRRLVYETRTGKQAPTFTLD